MEAKLLDLDKEIRSLYSEYSEVLSQKELDEGISAVFGSKVPSTPSTTPKSGRGRTGCCKVMLVVGLMYLAFYLAVTFIPAFNYVITLITQPMTYPLYRTVRFISLPFVEKLQFSGLYGTECLVSNPWFKHPSAECEECVLVKRIKTVTRPPPATLQYFKDSQPLVFTKAVEKNVSLEEVRALYHEGDNAYKLNTGLLHFSSNKVSSIGQFMDSIIQEDLKAQSDFHLEWATRGVPSARIIRKLFPRPYFIPKESEVTLEKQLYIDGPTAKTYTLKSMTYSSTWYVQAQGRRRLVFRPRDECIDTCKTHQVVMEPGQLVTFNDMVWQVDSVPYVEPGEDPDINLAFTGAYF